MESSYTWHEMSFHTKWTPNVNVAICFDVPKEIQRSIIKALSLQEHPWDLYDVYASHAVILEEIVHLFGRSVWAIRDEVRRIEKVFLPWFHLVPCAVS